MPEREEPQRADALRNRRLVIEAGLDLLAEDPSMGMQEIADASGLGRTTVYRHFPNREELIEAVLAEAVRQGRASTAAVIERGDDVTSTIRAVAANAVDINVRFRRFLATQEVGELAAQAGEDEGSPTACFLRDARASGEVRSDMPIRWQLGIMQTLASEAVEEVDAGAIDLDEARALVGETLVSILRS